MGAVRTAGRGSEVEASVFLLSAHSSQGDPTTLCSPPDVERTLTVGREAILEDSLEDSLDGANGLDDCVDWKNKVYQFYSLPTNRAKQTRPRASNALDGRQGRRVCTYNQPPRKGSIMAAPTPFRDFMLSFIPILPST